MMLVYGEAIFCMPKLRVQVSDCIKLSSHERTVGSGGILADFGRAHVWFGLILAHGSFLG